MTGPTQVPRSGAVGNWFNDRFRSGTAPYSLYCFPFAGGSAEYYADWAPHFRGPVDLVPIQLPGRGPRMAEPPAVAVEQIVEEVSTLIAARPTRPLLFGHSMGAILAFEVARRLRRLRRPADHLFVSGRPAPPIARPCTPVSPLPHKEFVEVLREYGAASEEVLAHQELLDVLTPMIRADFTLIEGYRYRPDAPLDCPVLAWCGEHDPEAGAEVMRGWGEQTSAGFTLLVRPGGHFFLTDYRADVARAIHHAVAELTNGVADAAR